MQAAAAELPSSLRVLGTALLTRVEHVDKQASTSRWSGNKLPSRKRCRRKVIGPTQATPPSCQMHTSSLLAQHQHVAFDACETASCSVHLFTRHTAAQVAHLQTARGPTAVP